ncbi:DUF998 domain-containing protein [Actinomyces vulturis]|uniref:DUF998 domain-containing protein n=1 Tax=Actinomyces vulturis TaxID=1857645 RepID=UPI00082CC290|nr:DUF998 domain-containing protein [Actinomyces vulturis]
MSRWPIRVAGTFLVVAIILYSTWVLAPLLGSRLDPFDSYVSELAAHGEPTALVARIGDTLCALALIVVGALGLRRGRKANLTGREATFKGTARLGYWMLWGGLVVVGLVTLIDIGMPMDCAVSLPACRAHLDAVGPTYIHQIHEVSSVSIWVLWLVAQCGGLLLTRTYLGKRRYPVIAKIALPLTVLCALYGPIAWWADATFTVPGLWQRIYLFFLVVWCAGLAADLVRARRF